MDSFYFSGGRYAVSEAEVLLYEYDETKPPILRPLVSDEAVRPDG
jgi:hypothetical protein